ncbi:MAG: 30S ribosomal protein S6 [Candidatus Dormiibacterota bacterium]
MNREYELFYIVRPDIDEDQARTAMDEVASLIAGHGGEMTKSSLWGRRRLAYPIAGFNDGYYALKELTLPAEKVRELERQLRLDERVIRHLVSLKQVYYLPGDEDRRGRVRTRGRDRGDAVDGSVPESGELTDDALEAEVAADDGFPDGAVEADEVAEPADDEDGEE